MRGYWAWRHSNDFDVTNHLSKTTRSDAGRPSLVAKTALTHQNVVSEITNPVLVALGTKELKRRCYNCYSYSEEIVDLQHDEVEPQGQKTDKLHPCEQCEIVYWCSQNCQQLGEKNFHTWECQIYYSLAPNILPSNLRAVLRILLLRQKGRPPDKYWNNLLTCDGNVEKLRKAGGSRWEDLIQLTQCAMEYSKTTETFDTVLGIFCSLLTYGFPLRTKEFETIGIAMHPIMAGVGHSCDPNSIIILGPHLKLGGSHNLEIVPVQNIARAEQITISYIDSSAPLSLRKAELKKSYFINCSCPKCSIETVTADPQQIADQSSTLEQVITLICDSEKDTTLHMPITRLRRALYLLLECSWPTHRYPFPLILRELIKAYIKDEQWNVAFAFACALRRSNKLVYPRRDNRLHPFRMADEYVLIVLMMKIIQADNWRAQKLDLTDRCLNLVGLRAYLYSRLQDDQRLVQSWKFGSTHHFAMILRVDQTHFQELVRDKEKRKKSKEGLNKLADEILDRARRW